MNLAVVRAYSSYALPNSFRNISSSLENPIRYPSMAKFATNAFQPATKFGTRNPKVRS